MLNYISSKSVPDTKSVSAINLLLHGWGGQIVDVFQDRGYYKSDDGKYRKIFAGPIIGTHNWLEKKKGIKKIGQISLSDTPPNYEKFNQDISLRQEVKVPLQVLENFLSAIFILPDRDGVIVPIKKDYADAFFGHSHQQSLFPPPEARLSEYKSYFGTHRVSHRLLVGKLLFFYQSQTKNTQGQVIGFARIARSNMASKNEADKVSKSNGVLDDSGFKNVTKNDIVLETVFTHSVIFPNPVSLKRLREIGCGDKANFVTAFNITHQQVCELLKEGGVL